MLYCDSISKATIIVFVAFLFSCQPNYSIEELNQRSANLDSISVEVANDVIITYTDSAQLRAVIKAPILKRYPDKQNPKLVMPMGVNATFFDANGDTTSNLVSRYAMHDEKKDFIEIRDSVRVINRNDEEIKTDELIWNKKKRTIISEKPVRVRVRNEKIIMAEGFESDESFLNYRFTRVTGVVYLEDELSLSTKE